MEGMGELCVLMVTKWFCRRDARRVRLAREKALTRCLSVPVMHHFQTLTIIHVYALRRESFWSTLVKWWEIPLRG
jgi:hypothetical protein